MLRNIPDNTSEQRKEPTKKQYAILYNDGNLSTQNIRYECINEGWLPLLALREENGKVIIPLFTNHLIAHKFMKKNISRKVKKGLVEIPDEKLETMTDKGWGIKFMDFPHRFTDHKKYKIDFEVLEISEEIGYKPFRKIENYQRD
ncbi:hypothetical protein CMI38_05355 [Candidatus Pacearchaeota archaeon]|jgi:hypothetical protein|nr:hypothetical protein [Candidatus Pacearchaeota archaeon]|tara:strand:+ start:7273 stop:7707 length:435 start_codon:yes stop_codon:yes gene_type:complete